VTSEAELGEGVLRGRDRGPAELGEGQGRAGLAVAADALLPEGVEDAEGVGGLDGLDVGVEGVEAALDDRGDVLDVDGACKALDIGSDEVAERLVGEAEHLLGAGEGDGAGGGALLGGKAGDEGGQDVESGNGVVVHVVNSLQRAG